MLQVGFASLARAVLQVGSGGRGDKCSIGKRYLAVIMTDGWWRMVVDGGGG